MQLKAVWINLGLPREAVNVEVLDEGQNGFLGIGNRQVRIRLTLLNKNQCRVPSGCVEEPNAAQADEVIG